MKKFFLISVCLFFISKFSGQTNLVPNSGFETNTQCPDYPGQINYATGWNNVNLVYANFTVGTPDYFHACGSASLGYNCVPPNTFAGTCSPRTGNGFAGTVLYNTGYSNYREYFSTQLTSPMNPGTTYTVSFWITNGSIPKSPLLIKNIGVNFSALPLTQSGWNLISLTPTYEITGYSGTTSWSQYTFTINPTTNWYYITLGNFRSDVTNAPVSTYSGTVGAPSAYAMYFWDDIEVWEPSAQSINEINSKYRSLSIYPNPSNDLVGFSSPEPIEEVSIANYLGEKIRVEKIDINDQKINTKDLPGGIYFLNFYYKNQLVLVKKFMKE